MAAMDSSFNRRADVLMIDGRYSEARALLDSAIQQMPAGWTPKKEEDRFVAIAFWDEEEFFAHSDHATEMGRSAKSIDWVDGSYSRAWHQLAVMAGEEGRYENALFCIDCGIELEPDHPELWNEKGYVLGRLKRHQEAFDSYLRATSVRDWAPPLQIARALRGQGVQLIDLDRLDEAEDAFRRSLELEPDSEVAKNELDYIENLRRKREVEEEEIPWFLRSFVNPPTDPLTVQLLALVADLPAIPGPKTVGSENYPRILDAFMKRGWSGFEEEFDRIVPRDRADYADVKRDMLCEPILKLSAHRNITDVVLGRKTFAQLSVELARQRDRKPH